MLALRAAIPTINSIRDSANTTGGFFGTADDTAAVELCDSALSAIAALCVPSDCREVNNAEWECTGSREAYLKNPATLRATAARGHRWEYLCVSKASEAAFGILAALLDIADAAYLWDEDGNPESWSSLQVEQFVHWKRCVRGCLDAAVSLCCRSEWEMLIRSSKEKLMRVLAWLVCARRDNPPSAKTIVGCLNAILILCASERNGISSQREVIQSDVCSCLLSIVDWMRVDAEFDKSIRIAALS